MVLPLILTVVVEEAVLVSEAGVPSLTLPLVEDINHDTPASELIQMKTATSAGVPSICLAGRRSGDGR